MTTDPTTYLRGKTGTLTVGSVDFGHCKVVSWGREGEPMKHVDATDGDGGIDKVINTGMATKITATVEQFDPDILAMLWGAGTASSGSFAVSFNDTEYSITWVFTLEDSDATYSTLTFHHTKCIITPVSTLEMSQGDWAGVPFELEIVKDADVATAPYGYWVFDA